MNHGERLRTHGLKVTLPRTKVLDVLREQEAHLGAEDIHRRLVARGEEIGLATVYRVLSQLEQVGLVQRQTFEAGHAVFELRRDGHHDHLVCRVCGRVEEFFDPQIEGLQEEVARARGFALVEHHLALLGVCGDCQGREPAGRRRDAGAAGAVSAADAVVAPVVPGSGSDQGL